MPRRPIQIFAGLVLLLAASIWVWQHNNPVDPHAAHKLHQTASAASSTMPVVKIGGDFNLQNTEGKTVSLADFKGRKILVFFGYTRCPDICPASLNVLSAALHKLGASADKVFPIFVSIDSAFDTPEVVKTYLTLFDPRIIGLTGTGDEIEKMVKNYKAYVMKQENNDAPFDHSSIFYLVDDEGSFLTHFNYTTDVGAFAAKLSEMLE